jgi:ribonuclease E
VEGAAGFKEAREFMRMLMPAQAKKVQLHAEPMPLFVKHKVEDHLSQIYTPTVPLRSGGYLVINQTEALVAIDVNSGRSTRERNIEATALKTNMEAAEEAARQLRLRDLAGLVVIDFIDMDEGKNNRAVEKKLKDCLKDDRARVQMGKISPFGLMEISRQRRRSGVLEGTTHVCEHCAGTGRVRSVESSALATLRALEMEAMNGGGEATLRAPRDVGLYILNEKRAHLARLQQNFGLFVTVLIDDALSHTENQIERTATETRPDHAAALLPAPLAAYEPIVDDAIDDDVFDDEEEDEDDVEEVEVVSRAAPSPARDDDDRGDDGDARRRGGRRRRGRGRGRDEPRDAAPPADGVPANTDAQPAADDDEGGHGRRRRRGRRGGRRMREDRPQDAFAWVRPWVPYGDDPFVWYDPAEDMKRGPAPANDPRPAPIEAEISAPTPAIGAAPAAEGADIWVELPAVEDRPKRPRRSRGRGRGGDSVEAPAPVSETVLEPAAEPVADIMVGALPEPLADNPEAQPVPEPRKPRSRARKATPVAEAVVAETAAPEPVAVEVAPEPEPPAPEPIVRAPDPAEISQAPAAPRKGWWRRG